MQSGTVLITGSAGLIGSEAALLFDRMGYQVHGLDNNARALFFGGDGDTAWNLERVRQNTTSLVHHDLDIRNACEIDKIVNRVKPDCIIHCAAQPAHDYARTHPVTDFHINVTGTMNLLDACRKYCPESSFVFCSSSKVYGQVNAIPFTEQPTRYELVPDTHLRGVSWQGVSEDFPIDRGDGRGIYGTGKAAADLLVQQYGETYGIPTACLRGNCMTGPAHSPTQLHGFLAYLSRCLMEGRTYTIFGYSGKQVRDIIHSFDFVAALYMIVLSRPRPGTVYNLGGGRQNSVSILEAVEMLESLSGKRLRTDYVDTPRHGDHRIYISDCSAFRRDFPAWGLKWSLEDICLELIDRFKHEPSPALTPTLPHQE